MTEHIAQPRLILIHGNHPESLRDLLVSWMKRDPLPPLENEVFLVQSNGIAQWLKLALASDPKADGTGGGCGIAAAMDFHLPSRFLWQVYRAVLGRDQVPEVSPFDKSRLIWRLMGLLPELIQQPVYAPLSRFLQNDADLRKRFQLSERLADLLDQYQVYRADWLQCWEEGQDILTTRQGGSQPLKPEDRWQPDLWRALLADVSRSLTDPGLEFHKGRAAVHEAFLEKASHWPEGQRPPGLPQRVMVFGISSLPQQSLEVLAHLGRWIQVIVCVPNPCQHYWGDIIPDQDLLRPKHSRHAVRQGWPKTLHEENLHQHAQPLLAAWGKQGRDFVRLLSEYDSPDSLADYEGYFTALGQPVDVFVANDRRTLLEQLQDDIRDLRPPLEAKDKATPVDPAKDGSLRFHICHSPQREVEVLQDQLLAAFIADPTLKPRDVIVMVPDIEAYAPSIQAVFGRLGRDDDRYLPFTIADQGQLKVDPLLKGLEQLLNLPQSRLGVSEIMGWLEVPAIRQRFGIDESAIPTLHRWIQGAQIRWGLHAEHRRHLELPMADDSNGPPQNSWLFGLRRMLVGYALGDTATDWQGIEPYDEIGGLEAALLGPLVLFVEQLEATWQTLQQPASVAECCQRFTQLLSDFFTAQANRDAFTLTRLQQALQEWETACAEAGLIEPLPLSVAGPYWLSLLENRGLSQRFFGGDITFATLMPMRAIPFRRVCLLGMNDGAYPRSHPPYDFDLMGRDPRPGDRSRREDDRYLFLEALLSAREHLHVSWVGHSITDNSERPPSVLVGQLRDHIRSVWRLADGDPADNKLLDQLTTVHRLQPFNPDYFPADPLQSRLFSYAREWQPGTVDSGPALTSALPPLSREEPLTLSELATFLKNPVKTFFRERLKVVFEQDDPATEDTEPFTLNGLQNWKLQDDLIKAQREVVEATGCAAEESESRRVAVLKEKLDHIARRGELADGGFRAVMRDALVEPMATMFEEYRKALTDWPIVIDEEVDFTFELMTDEGAVIVADRLGGIRQNAHGERARIVLESSNLLGTSKSEYRPSKALTHWVRHLAHHLAGDPITTVIVSKKGGTALKPLDPAMARTLFSQQIKAWSAGMTRPLPVAMETATTWLKTPAKAQTTYEGNDNVTGEVQKDDCLRRAYPDYADLVASGEFETLARQLVEPLLHAMPVDRPSRRNSASTEGEA